MKRTLFHASYVIVGLLICALVGGASGWAVARHRVPEILTPAQPSPHLMGATEPPSSSWFANERGAGHEWVNDPIFAGGAVGDFSHDDTAAIVAADAKAFAFPNGTVQFVQPPVAFKTTGPVTPSPGVTWTCNASSLGQCSIKAGASMVTVAFAHNTPPGAGLQTPTPNTIHGLTFDANGLALDAVTRTGDYFGTWDHAFFTNALRNGMRSASHRLPLTLGTVSCSGTCSPALPTISQPDLYYAGAGLANGATTFSLQITDGGARGTAKYHSNFGAGYQTAKQFVAAKSNVNFTNGAVYGPPTGVQVAFGAGTYTVSDVYQFTVTVLVEDLGAFGAINADTTFTNCHWRHNGSLTATAGIAGGYATGWQVFNATAPGSVSTVAGSQIITGTSTTWTSLGVQEGDFWKINSVLFPTASVLDDLTLAVPLAAAPTFTLSGLDYAVGVGSGYQEDSNSENVRSNIFAGSAGQNASSNFRFAGTQGPVVTQTQNELYGFAAYSFGATAGGMTGVPVLTHAHVESGSTGSVTAYVWSGVGVTAIEPSQIWNTSGPGGGIKILGTQFIPFGNSNSTTNIPMFAESESAITVPLSTGAETIPAPTTFSTVSPSLVYLAPTANVTMTSAPTIAVGAFDGQIIKLINASQTFTVVLQNNQQSSSKLDTTDRYISLGPEGSIEFSAKSSRWWQRTQVVNDYLSNAGNGDGHWRNVVTTNNTPKEIWDWQVVGAVGGTTTVFDVVAQSNETNFASWTGYTAMWDNSHNLLAYSAGNAMGNGAGNGPPLGWTIGPAIRAGNQYAVLLVTGDNTANPVNWKIYQRHLAPPP